ncbi:2-C-methyl-D-erythritol 2,4-cyclodiphosphate synthase [Vagococcus salmoninarum]|uniref:2-C-methyl-D-erythritol 2,4-cyclodiphosphate synthase n=1 Tax=Vagococcus salmoninarum TaxID=2739 RepID=A0A429ZQV4_9ENTE|nr:2-C-methyl-D-erythritol 2,4-cyclodiphosphate synthase [Vagococcus salmoninarum]RST96067.1 2-C-methyl-D-erythritol 2,4-cyclodiphosphate synthase [Vagococcus salmoninarum]
MRIGQGFDVHQLVPNRPCIIGGVTLPFNKGLLGHSDADVLLHAITDALLGAAGLGDIGKMYPDTDQQYLNADSMVLLRGAWQAVKAQGYTIGNLDCTILAERPKMLPYISAMKNNISEACELSAQQINLKATTMETMGFIGREEGIGALAVVLLKTQK